MRLIPLISTVAPLLATVSAAGCSGVRPGDQPQERTPESPRIAALHKESKAGNRTVLESFWREMKGKAPLMEPITGDDGHLRVTFIWRTDEGTRSVSLWGGLPSAELTKRLARLTETDLWYRTERVPKDARFAYTFIVNEPAEPPKDFDEAQRRYQQFPPKPDPLNGRALLGQSIVELPDAPPQPWLERQPGVAEGEIRARSIESSVLAMRRPVTIYKPPGYHRSGAPYGLLIVLDGEAYGSNAKYTVIPTSTILNNLIASEKIPPLVAVLVDNIGRRMSDLPCSAPFADFLAKELVPWVRNNYHVGDDPSRVIVCGSSAGGLCAAYCGLKYPEVFGCVLSQSGWFAYTPDLPRSMNPDYATETGWLIRQFATTSKRPLRFYLEVGRFERFFLSDTVAENRRMRDVLEAKGYPVTYSEYDGGHNYVCWRGSLADGLIALSARDKRE